MPHPLLRVVVIVLLACGCGGATKPAATTTVAPAAASDLSAPTNPDAAPSPQWIWGPDEPKAGEERFFRVAFDAGIPKVAKTEDPFAAWLWAACDDEMTIFLNGKQLTKHRGHDTAYVEDVRSMLRAGENVLAIRCKNDAGPAALAVKLEVRRQYGDPFVLVSDQSWLSSDKQPGRRWREADFRGEASFVKSRVVGPYGMEPYGKLAAAPPAQATAVENLTLLPGFKAELVYSVPRGAQGSWVSMTPDPKGRLYVSDQNGGLFRVTPASGDKETLVEEVDLDIGSAQGLLWAFDSLYVVVNGGKAPHDSGMYRLKDTDNDDKLDQVTTLKKFQNRERSGPAGGEHGPHAVVLGPDKKLYVVAGNFTSLPEAILPTSPAQNWNEDLLLPRMTDGKGHDPTIYAPGSWVCRTDEEGKTWENLTVGMRNAYDIDFSPEGELLTFDSDMEWDIGTPWWRPIRVYHLVSGGEYGWRNGSAKWPAYYPDVVPPTADMGMGSPTGVTFGQKAKFPPKYQRAFFVGDWAYGKIFAVHLTPDGASYKAEYEPFVTGKPFGVTDLVINPLDGAMYVTIGGRGTQSGLYRVTYAGSESTAPAPAVVDEKAAAARELRRKLETFHGKRDASAIAFAWPHLKSDDRYIRYAARVAVESQDPTTWTDKALAETDPTTAIQAIVALCRVGNASLQPNVLDALGRLDLKKLSREQLLEALRAYELCFIRLGRPWDPAALPNVVARLEPLFPADNDEVNHELTQLLVYAESPKIIEKSLALLDKAKAQEEQLFYAFNLRNVAKGWTQPQREQYFTWLNRAQQHYRGGASFKQFLQKVRAESVATLGDNEKEALAALIKPPMDLGDDASKGPPRSFVRSWQMADLTPKLAQLNTGRSFEKGKAAYDAVSCAKCHRFNGEGGASGPDISGVGNRFQPADLLEAIVLPSKIISDQYQATEIITTRKEVVSGMVQSENDQQIVIQSSPLSNYTETVKKDQVQTRRPSKTSIMPSGLIDVLSEDEILDLLAYLRSGGNPNDPAFKKVTETATAAPTTSSAAAK